MIWTWCLKRCDKVWWCQKAESLAVKRWRHQMSCKRHTPILPDAGALALKWWCAIATCKPQITWTPTILRQFQWLAQDLQSTFCIRKLRQTCHMLTNTNCLVNEEATPLTCTTDTKPFGHWKRSLSNQINYGRMLMRFSHLSCCRKIACNGQLEALLFLCCIADSVCQPTQIKSKLMSRASHRNPVEKESTATIWHLTRSQLQTNIWHLALSQIANFMSSYSHWVVLFIAWRSATLKRGGFLWKLVGTWPP